MATRFDGQIMIVAGTSDGVYVLEGDTGRSNWTQRGPYLTGLDVSHAILDPRDCATIWAAGTGQDQTAVYRSRDRGESWEMAGQPFGNGVDQVWHVEPAVSEEVSTVYAGVRPAALYRSDDAGDSWLEVSSLSNHPSRNEWWEGGGGLCLHTIMTDPNHPDSLFIGMSVGGVFYSSDGGQIWEARNEGTFSMAEGFEQIHETTANHPEVHRCVHKFVRHPRNGQLFQQNHVGVYRSDDYGKNWVDISDGLPDRFGFVIGTTWDGAVYVVPQHDWNEESGVGVTGQLAVYRSKNAGRSWERLSDGLPEIENVTLYREGMDTDRCDPGGIYFGTSDGRLLGSSDGGDTWSHLARDLPPIRSISCEHYS